jgi:UrcA family protein
MSVTTSIPPYRLALCAAVAAGLALAAPGLRAQAQDYGRDNGGYDNGQQYDDNGGVTVTAEPRARREYRDPYTGAPYERVTASRVVRYADLNLHSRRGVRELKARVERAAEDACDELENSNTISAPDDPPCVPTAVRRAMYRVPIPDYFSDEY